jgi:branched-chain amino acid transport system permease protein
VGAYAAALVMLHTGFTDLIGLLGISAVAGALLSLPIAALSLRIRQEYFAVTSLGFAFAFIAALNNLDFLGLAEGLVGIPPMTIGPWQLVTPATVLAACAAVAAVVVAATVWLVRSRWGLRMEAVRDSERGAISFGINPTAMRISAVALSGMGAGVAGTLYVVYAEFVSPDTFDLSTLALIVAMLGLGQMFGLAGYLIGPAVLVAVSAALQYLHVLSLTVLGPVNQIIYGLVMVVAILLVPHRRRRAGASGGLVQTDTAAQTPPGQPDPGATSSHQLQR